MDQGPNIQLVAEQMVRSLGPRAYAHVYEQAELAKLSGDRESAITWWDIALAVIEIRSLHVVAAGLTVPGSGAYSLP